MKIEEVALHAANDWFEDAQFRSDVRADLQSYYEGFRDALRFCNNKQRELLSEKEINKTKKIKK